MKTFESVFPILIVPKTNTVLDKIENLPSDFGNGTGFFVSEDGLFMSVGHIFKNEKECDFYAVLVSGEEKVLKRITNYQVEYISQDFNPETHKGRDLAMGKIDLEGDQCESFKVETAPTSSSFYMMGYKKNETDSHDKIKITLLCLQLNAESVLTYNFIQKIKISNSFLNDHYKQMKPIELFFEKKREIDNSSGLHGLSGLPLYDQHKDLQGIFFRGGEIGTDEEYDHGFFIPVTNPYFKRLYHRFQEKLFVKALESFSEAITEGKEYKLILHKNKYFPKGEECVRGKRGKLVTLGCFKHEFIYK